MFANETNTTNTAKQQICKRVSLGESDVENLAVDSAEESDLPPPRLFLREPTTKTATTTTVTPNAGSTVHKNVDRGLRREYYKYDNSIPSTKRRKTFSSSSDSEDCGCGFPIKTINQSIKQTQCDAMRCDT